MSNSLSIVTSFSKFSTISREHSFNSSIICNDKELISVICDVIVYYVVMRELYSVGCIGVLPFIEDLSETVQSGLVASSRDSEEYA